MLATLVDKPFDDPGWHYEVKWDGYRALAFCEKKTVSLVSRNKKTFDEKFYPIHQSLVKWGIHAVLDGEIVVVNEQGLSNFNNLQNWRSEDDGELLYYLFDIIWLDGHDLRTLTLEERRDILRRLKPPADNIRISEDFNAGGLEFFTIAEKMGLEGIIAKKGDSTYTAGLRSREWLKIKTHKRHEVVIGGYTINKDSPKLFSALLVGVFENGHLQYTGKIGTGFSMRTQEEMMKQFKPLIRKTCPFTETPDVNKPSRFRPNPPSAKAIWLKPELVCEVSYQEMTPDGVMRQPSFEGMRIDKKASSVTRETPKDTDKVVAAVETEENELTKKKIVVASKGKTRKTLLNPTDETQVRIVEGHELTFNNLSKLYWPKEKISKRDMINYYYQVAP
ncbi:MAG: non-homologous end-joining DNA ligase, partial [Bacteroidetes bacterium]|nr:non-homologous end-joining DNA ligase [Bacteroidota bacterium]